MRKSRIIGDGLLAIAFVVIGQPTIVVDVRRGGAQGERLSKVGDGAIHVAPRIVGQPTAEIGVSRVGLEGQRLCVIRDGAVKVMLVIVVKGARKIGIGRPIGRCRRDRRDRRNSVLRCDHISLRIGRAGRGRVDDITAEQEQRSQAAHADTPAVDGAHRQATTERHGTQIAARPCGACCHAVVPMLLDGSHYDGVAVPGESGWTKLGSTQPVLPACVPSRICTIATAWSFASTATRRLFATENSFPMLVRVVISIWSWSRIASRNSRKAVWSTATGTRGSGATSRPLPTTGDVRSSARTYSASTTPSASNTTTKSLCDRWPGIITDAFHHMPLCQDDHSVTLSSALRSDTS